MFYITSYGELALSGHANIDLVIQQYSKSIGITISLAEGANTLTTADGREVWLEVSSTGDLLLVHSEVMERASHRLNADDMLQFLEVNADIETMKGAWLSFHEGTDSLRLCTVLPSDIITLNYFTTRFEAFLQTQLDVTKKYII